MTQDKQLESALKYSLITECARELFYKHNKKYPDPEVYIEDKILRGFENDISHVLPFIYEKIAAQFQHPQQPTLEAIHTMIDEHFEPSFADNVGEPLYDDKDVTNGLKATLSALQYSTIPKPISDEAMSAMADEFTQWLDEVIRFNKESIFGTGADDIQIRLLEQVKEKYKYIVHPKNKV